MIMEKYFTLLSCRISCKVFCVISHPAIFHFFIIVFIVAENLKVLTHFVIFFIPLHIMQIHFILMLGTHLTDLAMHFHWKIQYNLLFFMGENHT